MENQKLIDRYNRLTRVNNTFRISDVATYVPNPTEDDYHRGYITRHFAQKANDNSAPIIEVDSNEFARLSNNPYARTVKLDWKISGSSDKIKEANRKSLSVAYKKMKRITLYLPNLLQFSEQNKF